MTKEITVEKIDIVACQRKELTAQERLEQKIGDRLAEFDWGRARIEQERGPVPPSIKVWQVGIPGFAVPVYAVTANERRNEKVVCEDLNRPEEESAGVFSYQIELSGRKNLPGRTVYINPDKNDLWAYFSQRGRGSIKVDLLNEDGHNLPEAFVLFLNFTAPLGEGVEDFGGFVVRHGR